MECLFPPSAIGALPDDDDHYIAFRQDVAYFCSKKPRRLEYGVSGNRHARLFEELAQTAEQKPDRRLFLSPLDHMREALEERDATDSFAQSIAAPEFWEEESVVRIARTAAFLARLRFDAEIVLLRRNAASPT
ncbi:MAG: hypothetical protein ABI680_00610 [Chthoniobacteraceae bacterium]